MPTKSLASALGTYGPSLALALMPFIPQTEMPRKAVRSVGRFIYTGPETLGTRQCEAEGEEAGSTSRAFRHRAYLPDTSYKEAVLSIGLDILGVNLIL